MTTLIPREAYSPEELQRLYPKDLKLQLVQVVSLVIYTFQCAERVGVANYPSNPGSSCVMV